MHEAREAWWGAWARSFTPRATGTLATLPEAFAASGCAGYFVYHLRPDPPPIIYIDPDLTAAGSVTAEGGFEDDARASRCPDVGAPDIPRSGLGASPRMSVFGSRSELSLGSADAGRKFAFP